MRYVIGVCILTGGIIWDAVYFDGHYLDMGVRWLRMVGGMVGLHI
jgi:hypothetical protein